VSSALSCGFCDDRDIGILDAGENSRRVRLTPRQLRGFPFCRLSLAMNVRARASWRRHTALFLAVLLHIGLLALILPYMINRSQPPVSEPVDVAIVPPAQPPKPIRPTPAVHPAETNSSAARPHFQPAPRLAHVFQPRLHLTLPPPISPKPPMSLPAASVPPESGAPGNGSGGNSTGAGNGSQEGNDYLKRLKAYIDAHKSGARHWEPNDADVVLVLDRNGLLTDIHVVSSSGDPLVDEDIVTQLRQMSPFPKPPAVLFSASKPLLPVADKWIFPRP
jgi:TonB family protein